jgi:hypothetical protein
MLLEGGTYSFVGESDQGDAWHTGIIAVRKRKQDAVTMKLFLGIMSTIYLTLE